MKKWTKTIVCVFLLALGAAAVSGCHTAHGFGEDMESAGQGIQNGTR